MRRLLLSLSLLLGGCAYKVEVRSLPSGARMVTPDGVAHTLPATVDLQGVPTRRQWVTVSAPGYRTVELHLGKRAVNEGHYLSDWFARPKAAFGDRPRRRVMILLVPEHGPAGTWDREDIPE